MVQNGSNKTASALPPSKAKRVRSPNYPGLNLEAAIKRTEEFFEVERRNPANVAVAVKHWGFNSTSSGGIVTLAALKSFGLIDDEGNGKDRKVKISSLGLKIIQDKRPVSPEREAAIKEAAVRPAIHAKLWSQWKSEFPSDDNFRHVLEVDYNFNKKAVEGFMREYKETIGFAKLAASDIISSEVKDSDSEPEGKYVPKIGDYVQWTSQGADQFEQPQRIREFSDDGKFLFINGSLSGIPVEQVTKRDPPTGEKETGEKGPNITSIPTVVKRPAPKPGMRNDVFTLDEGEVILQWPDHMSAESYEDFQAWLELIAKKAKRVVGRQEPTK